MNDISEHIYTLIDYGKQCSHITEFGVRGGNSTLAWVKARPKRLVCYDIKDCDCVPEIQSACSECGILFKFIKADSRNVNIEMTDLLFVDTFHSDEQLSIELRWHHRRVLKWIILHDTESFGEKGEDGKRGGLKQALGGFLLDQFEHWRIKEHFRNCNGLTILERV